MHKYFYTLGRVCGKKAGGKSSAPAARAAGDRVEDSRGGGWSGCGVGGAGTAEVPKGMGKDIASGTAMSESLFLL